MSERAQRRFGRDEDARAAERRWPIGVDFRCWAGRILAAWRPTSDQGPVSSCSCDGRGRRRRRPNNRADTIDERFVDEELAEACGIDDVTATVNGFVIERTFAGEGAVVAQVNSINVGVTETTDDRTFRFRDVGADVVQIKPDGSLVLLITGQVPFAFAGALKIDLDTEEVILEPRDRSEQQLAKACTALTGA